MGGIEEWNYGAFMIEKEIVQEKSGRENSVTSGRFRMEDIPAPIEKKHRGITEVLVGLVRRA